SPVPAPPDPPPSSQAGLLSTKPDYGRILEAQGEALSSVELALDELQQAANLVQAFSEDSRRFLQRLSQQLGETEPTGNRGGRGGG
ncbi:PREDICTED: kinetochore-associated protein DSN1 homolog, partial [Calidris pugnax]|uniref:kinetochore-associated protein DSN1 homolog n=1 Tax=Calidris pugnax TaxID=198806 RepID=UPI00071DE678